VWIPWRVHRSALCAENFESKMFMNAALRNEQVHDAVQTIFNLPQSLVKLVPSKRKPPAERNTEIATVEVSWLSRFFLTAHQQHLGYLVPLLGKIEQMQ